MKTKTTKAQKILDMTADGVSAIQIAKKMGVSPAYVYVVRSKAKKKAGKAKKKAGKAEKKYLKAMKTQKQSKIVKAVTEMKQALDVIEKKPTKLIIRPEHKDAALKLLGMKEVDLVNSPPHYTNGGIETIDYIEAKDLNYRLGNVIKYVSRAEKKGEPLQDLKKALWYLQRDIELREKA